MLLDTKTESKSTLKFPRLTLLSCRQNPNFLFKIPRPKCINLWGININNQIQVKSIYPESSSENTFQNCLFPSAKTQNCEIWANPLNKQVCKQYRICGHPLTSLWSLVASHCTCDAHAASTAFAGAPVLVQMRFLRLASFSQMHTKHRMWAFALVLPSSQNQPPTGAANFT